MRISNQQKGIFIFIIMMACTIITHIYVTRSSPLTMNSVPVELVASLSSVKEVERSLIIYVWANEDEQSLGNLQFFVRHGVNALQPADYYFILQNIDKKSVNESELPLLPPNAHYIQDENECYDIGTFGWFLSQNIANTTLYKYFFFMNSSIRGPFLLPYFETAAIWWFHIFIQLFTDEIKLVGSTINCEDKPHVQSYLFATDQIGLSILTSDKSEAFNCKSDPTDAIYNGEMAISQLFLQANYQIASLQSKYQGWDFRKNESASCNNQNNPIWGDNAFNGTSHDPYELIFVKYQDTPSDGMDFQKRAVIYERWIDQRRQKNQTNAIKIE